MLQMVRNQLELAKDDIWCVHKYLDEQGIPRISVEGKTFSIVGRIEWMKNRILKEMSEMENEYLKKIK